MLDLTVHDALICDITRHHFYKGWLGIKDGRFLYVEPGDVPAGVESSKTVDANGKYVIPGFVDAHMHIESSLVTPRRFAEAVLPFGTTTILADPHEIANAIGMRGVQWMIRVSEELPLRVYFAIPSCVPATSPHVEWTSSIFNSTIVSALADEPAIVALGEVMDYRKVGRLAGMIETAEQAGLSLEGHIPDLRGMELSEYLSWGMSSNHSASNIHDILEQLTKGITVMLQEKALTEEIMSTLRGLRDWSHILLVTDDIEPNLLIEGHLSSTVVNAIEAGMPLFEALASVTVRPAQYLGLKRLGIIGPGYQADFQVLDTPTGFPARAVYVRGKKIAAKGKMIVTIPKPPATLGSGLGLKPFRVKDFILDRSGKLVANAIVADGKPTELERIEVKIDSLGLLRSNAGDDVASWTIVARNGRSQSTGVVKGLGLRSGAYASTLAHDSHNLMVIGRDAEDMAVAANAVREGGIAVSNGGQILAYLGLPIAGLLSDEPPAVVGSRLTDVEDALRTLGMERDRPFKYLSFLALTVSPSYKMSDKGVVDVKNRAIIPPFV